MAVNVLARMAKVSGSKRLCDYFLEKQEVMDAKDRKYIIDYQIKNCTGLGTFLNRCSKNLNPEEARGIVYAICDPRQISYQDRFMLKITQKTHDILFSHVCNNQQSVKLINDLIENDLIENFLCKFSNYLCIESSNSKIIIETIAMGIDSLVVSSSKHYYLQMLADNAQVNMKKQGGVWQFMRD